MFFCFVPTSTSFLCNQTKMAMTALISTIAMFRFVAKKGIGMKPIELEFIYLYYNYMGNNVIGQGDSREMYIYIYNYNI